MDLILLAGLLACATPPPAPEEPAPTWTQPEPRLLEHRLTVPEGRRAELLERSRSELLALARPHGLRRLESIEMDLSCSGGQCEAVMKAMALP